MRRLYIIIMCSLLLAACAADDHEPTSGSSTPIAFSATLATPDTRAPQSAIDDKNTLASEGGFGVFACYTGLHRYSDSNVRPDFMYNEHVTSNDNGNTWTYAPLKYWPNGEGEVDGNTGKEKHYVSFMAYAPYSDNSTGPSGYCIPSFSLQGEQGNPWLTYRLHTDVNEQVDLLYAEPLLDQMKPTTNYKLPFVFNHALACVGDKVTINCSPAMQSQLNTRLDGGISNIRVDVTKLEIVYTLTSKARLVLWNGGEANWEPIFSEDPLCTRTVTLVDADHPVVIYAYKDITPVNSWKDKGVFYIPIGLPGFPQTAKVDVAYHISTSENDSDWTSDTSQEGSVTLYLKDYIDTAYKPGKHLYINIAVNDVTFTVTAAIADWEYGDTKDGIEAI